MYISLQKKEKKNNNNLDGPWRDLLCPSLTHKTWGQTGKKKKKRKGPPVLLQPPILLSYFRVMDSTD